MIFLSGDPPDEPMLVLVCIQPDGSSQHVMLRMPPDLRDDDDIILRYITPALAHLRNRQAE